MRVIKKINNNVALACDQKNEEYIIVGKGVGFPKVPYDLKDDSVIEKIFVAPKSKKLFEVLNDIPIENILLAEKIIEAGKKLLKADLNNNIVLTLSDHINFALERSRDAIQSRSPLEWEIKNLYPEETKVGALALEIIEEETGIVLPQSEITFIAFHFVNAQIGTGDISTTTMITQIIGDILSIVKYYFKLDFEDDRINLTRFATHIRYFIIREINAKVHSNENNDIFLMLKDKHPETYKCVMKIEKYLMDNQGWTCSNDEKLYLILHIERLKAA